MSSSKSNKPLVSVLMLISMLAATVLLFSIPAVKGFFESKNIIFPSLGDLKESYFPASSKDKVKNKKVDSTSITSNKNLNETEKKKVDTLLKKIQFLEDFTVGDNTALYNFFKSLETVKNKSVHIWYYGDSQIEGDRITQEIRKVLQSRFGGGGQGFVPFQDVASYMNVQLKTGPEWFKENCFVNKSPKGYGFAGRVFKLNGNDSVNTGTASVFVSNNLKYDKLYLLHGKSIGGTGRVIAEGYSSSFNLEETSSAGKILISDNPLNGNIKLKLPGGTNYFGYLFESNSGVQIDNCGIRGHSGDGLAYISDDIIKTQAKQLNTKLVVFQFGNNMIPYIKPGEKNMNYYQDIFYQLFKRYKDLLPNASILVISNGDMGTYRGGVAQSYPHLPEFTETLRQAAKRAGCAFFSFYDLMQSDGGILGWKKAGYAQLDGHLSPTGQQHMAGTLYKELMRAYEIHKITTP